MRPSIQNNHSAAVHMPRVDHCRLIPIPQITDGRGNIGVVETLRDIPFLIRRVYYSYDTPADVVRGGHAHKELHQLIIAIAGRFHITLDDGIKKRSIVLNSRSEGLYICPMIWRDISNFSQDAVCLVFASENYDESDYIREYQSFIEASREVVI